MVVLVRLGVEAGLRGMKPLLSIHKITSSLVNASRDMFSRRQD